MSAFPEQWAVAINGEGCLRRHRRPGVHRRQLFSNPVQLKHWNLWVCMFFFVAKSSFFVNFLFRIGSYLFFNRTVLQVTEKWFPMMDRSASQTAEVTWGEFLSVLCHWRWKSMASKRSETALRYHICKDAGYKKPCEKGPPPDNGRDGNQGETIMQAPSFELIAETANEQKGLKSDKNKLCTLINHQTQFINPTTESGQHNRSLVTGTTDYARCEMRNSDQCSWLKLRVAQSKQCKKWENGYWSFWLVLGGTLHRRRREQGAESKKEEKSIITHHKGACKQVVGFLLGLVLGPLRYAFHLPWAGYLGHFGTASV